MLQYFGPFLLGLGVGSALVLLANYWQCSWGAAGGGLWRACEEKQGEVEVLLHQVAPAPKIFLYPPQESEDVELKQFEERKEQFANFKQVPFYPIHKNEVVKGCPTRPLHLVVLILSAPGASRRRAAIRGTWVHDYRSRVVTATAKFLVGTLNLELEKAVAIEKEQEMFGDLLILRDLQDSYANLSTKVHLGLKWATQNMKYDYLVKVDDDSYVRIEGISNALRKLDCDDHLYWGYFMGHAYPETSGKWAEHKWFQCPHYFPYAMGGGYVLAQRAVELLMKFSHRLILYNNEDVTVASWLVPYRLNRKHDIRFDVESLSHGCNNGYLITHKERVKSFYTKFTSLIKNNTLCMEEKEIRPAYIYNWTGSPLDCCTRIKGLPVT